MLHHVRIQGCVRRCIGSGRKACFPWITRSSGTSIRRLDHPGRGFSCSRALIEILKYPVSSHQPHKMSMKAVSSFIAKFVSSNLKFYSLEKDCKKLVYTWTTSDTS